MLETEEQVSETLPEPRGMLYHVGVSGGKDSTAVLLYMVKESGIPLHQIVATFCDTKNEAECTYEHILKLSRDVFPILWLESPGFKSLTDRWGFFPTPMRRFCTQELKLKPAAAFIRKLEDEGFEVVGVSGIRRGESYERSRLPEWGNPMDSYFGIREWRPLIDWSFDQVLAIHQQYGVPMNPLYSKGAQRVGCFPCINSRKAEIRAMARSFPSRIDELREWEQSLFNERGYQSFFQHSKIPRRFRRAMCRTAKGKQVSVATIDDVVEWAMTGKGGSGQAPDIGGLFEFMQEDAPLGICMSQSLACE
jgi:3'-phosphoadenosine 5'-phosphosulfate sulfotransferase (PAPS reductase)/FAD synthetase